MDDSDMESGDEIAISRYTDAQKASIQDQDGNIEHKSDSDRSKIDDNVDE